MEKSAKIFVAGNRGLVGSAIERNLKKKGYHNLLGRTERELDLRRQPEVEAFLSAERPEYLFMAAAKVGGIQANNQFPADFIYDNLAIETNIIHSAYKYGVQKLIFLGSSCIYPKYAPQPIKEEYILTGALEPTNEAYALAKIAGLKMCEFYNRQYGTNYISVMPTNLYGLNDNFDLDNSHVIPALIRKFHEAQVGNKPYVEIWGTGSPRREFLYVDDLADACVFLMENYGYEDIGGHINIGTGEDLSIKDLANMIKKVVGYKGGLVFDTGKPDGTPRKLLDVSRIKNLGWQPTTSLEDGLNKTYAWYLAKNKSFKSYNINNE